MVESQRTRRQNDAKITEKMEEGRIDIMPVTVTRNNAIVRGKPQKQKG